MKTKVLIFMALAIVLLSCNRNKFEHDASGTFEATEVIVSAEAQGKVMELNLKEGDVLKRGQLVGFIDTTQLYLKKLQLQSVTRGISVRKPNIGIQISSLKEQISKAETEKQRVDKLFADGAATQKQVDDVASQLSVLRRMLDAQVNSLSTSVNTLDAESNTYDVQIMQIEDQLQKSYILNPIEGTILSKYVEASEVANLGKPLYKIADTKNLFLRVYLVSTQLEEVKLGQKVKVYINAADDKQKTYEGSVAWISDKAEFTPKTIQTKDERQNLVYAVKISVANTDNLIKIGMYGDVDFK